MAAYKLAGFKFRRPFAYKQLLGDLEAQVATNLRPGYDRLVALAETVTHRAIVTVGTVKTLWRYRADFWFESTAEVDFVRGQVVADAHDRVCIIGNGVPKYTYAAIATSGQPYPSATYDLGLPPPATAPTPVVVGAPDDVNDLAETRYYVVTFVDVLGAEGPPSLASIEVEVKPGQTVDLGLPTGVGGAYNLTSKRIYRSATGSSGSSVFQYVAGTALATTTYNDAIPTDALGEVLPSLTWDKPPTDLLGAIEMPGGFIAAWRSSELCFSELGYPHAWPIEYRIPTKDKVVGLVLVDSSIMVMTEGAPAIAMGTTPASMTLANLRDVNQACVSRRSICKVPGGAVYASPDGLVLMSSRGTNISTEGVFTRAQWQALVPSSMVCLPWEDRVLVQYNTGPATGSFVFDPNRPQDGIIDYADHATAGHYEPTTDILHLVVGSSQKKWDAGATRSLTWKSKQFVTPAPINLGVAKVRATAYPVTFTLFGDNVQQYQVAVQNDAAFRLPGGYRAEKFEVQLAGTGEIVECVLAKTMTHMSMV